MTEALMKRGVGFIVGILLALLLGPLAWIVADSFSSGLVQL
jgi:hypothetical protein